MRLVVHTSGMSSLFPDGEDDEWIIYPGIAMEVRMRIVYVTLRKAQNDRLPAESIT